jgi:hypothetical protein
MLVRIMPKVVIGAVEVLGKVTVTMLSIIVHVKMLLLRSKQAVLLLRVSLVGRVTMR